MSRLVQDDFRRREGASPGAPLPILQRCDSFLEPAQKHVEPNGFLIPRQRATEQVSGSPQPETAQRDALFVIDKLQHKLRAITRLRRWQVSFSIGVAVFRSVPDSATLAMEFADRLMYAAKNKGKGVTVWNVFGDPKGAPVVWQVGVTRTNRSVVDGTPRAS